MDSVKGRLTGVILQIGSWIILFISIVAFVALSKENNDDNLLIFLGVGIFSFLLFFSLATIINLLADIRHLYENNFNKEKKE